MRSSCARGVTCLGSPSGAMRATTSSTAGCAARTARRRGSSRAARASTSTPCAGRRGSTCSGRRHVWRASSRASRCPTVWRRSPSRLASTSASPAGSTPNTASTTAVRCWASNSRSAPYSTPSTSSCSSTSRRRGSSSSASRASTTTRSSPPRSGSTSCWSTLARLEGRRAVGAHPHGHQPARPRQLHLYALRRTELVVVPLRHPSAQPAAGSLVALLSRAERETGPLNSGGPVSSFVLLTTAAFCYRPRMNICR